MTQYSWQRVLGLPGHGDNRCRLADSRMFAISLVTGYAPRQTHRKGGTMGKALPLNQVHAGAHRRLVRVLAVLGAVLLACTGHRAAAAIPEAPTPARISAELAFNQPPPLFGKHFWRTSALWAGRSSAYRLGAFPEPFLHASVVEIRDGFFGRVAQPSMTRSWSSGRTAAFRSWSAYPEKCKGMPAPTLGHWILCAGGHLVDQQCGSAGRRFLLKVES